MSTDMKSQVEQLGVTPWKIIEHFRDSVGHDPERDRQRKQDFANALANAIPENPAQWRRKKFIGDLPTTVYYPTALFGEIGVKCTALGRYRLVRPTPD